MEQLIHKISDRDLFEKRLLTYFKEEKNIVFLNSNDKNRINLFAVSNSDLETESGWRFGFITYDYKNQIEDLCSHNYDGIGFPEMHFFTPEILFKIDQLSVNIYYNRNKYAQADIEEILVKIGTITFVKANIDRIKIKNRVLKKDYIKNVKKLKEHIQLGDIYEVNYCQEYFAEQVKIDPIQIYQELNKKSPTPFSCYVKHNEKYLISATPERFMHKTGKKIVSQPIKGTIKRGANAEEDSQLKTTLYNDLKERSENVMIVDLVRNDLSKIAKKGTVEVDELFGIYTFPQVHQMISTVSGELEQNIEFDDIIQATFPMGSMTGAPKIRAMELIEQYEHTKRGLYSGTVGYINDQGDFDFNVIIRSLQYNKKDEYLSFMVGGAITALSEPEKEYDECLLKAKAMLEVLGN